MTTAPWQVVVVPFPYSDRLAEKRRPALVVSAPALEAEHGLVWVAMVTSRLGGQRPQDVVISDLKAAGLSAPSLVRAAKLATIEPARILRLAGSLLEADAASVAAMLDAYRAAAPAQTS